MKQENVMNHFVSAIQMGEEIFGIYREKAEDQKLKLILIDFIASFGTQKENLINDLIAANFTIEEGLSMLQKNAIAMERMRVKLIQNDYDLGIRIIDAMSSAIKGALKYYRKCDAEIRIRFRKSIREILANYENIIGKIKTYLINLD